MDSFAEFKYTVFRDMYYKQVDRRDSINKNLGLPATILILIGSILYFFTIKEPVFFEGEAIRNFLVFLYWIFILILFLCFSYTMVRFFTILFNYFYRHLSFASEISKYFKDMENYALQNNISDPELLKETYESLADQYVECVDVHITNNDLRSSRYHDTMVGASICVILIVVTGVVAAGIKVMS